MVQIPEAQFFPTGRARRRRPTSSFRSVIMTSSSHFASRGALVALVVSLCVFPLVLGAQAAPAGAKFKCGDGTFSSAKTAQGACSGHGGVASTVTAATPAASAPAARTPAASAPPAAAPAAAVPAGATFKCTDGSYSTARTRQGACSAHGGVASAVANAAAAPRTPPAGATALCKDGSYYSNKARQGACTGHGGVERWL